MKIGKPVTESEVPYRSSYGSIWSAARSLPDDDVLPVKFESLKKARTFQGGNYSTARRHGLRMRLRGSTIYISRNGTD